MSADARDAAAAQRVAVINPTSVIGLLRNVCLLPGTTVTLEHLVVGFRMMTV
jgi:hypothetical protein